MDVKYIGGDVPWTLPFGDHFNSTSQPSFTDTDKKYYTSASDLETIARRHGFEPLYSTNENQSEKKSLFNNDNLQWMNSGILFTDKTIESDLTRIHKTDFSDNHGHTFCYLCSINQHDHERTKPRDQSQRRKLIPYNNPKALKIRPSSSVDRTGQDLSTSNLIPYRFIVRTGTRKNSGTRAQVFLYMYGTENTWTSINLRAHTNQTIDGFPSGSIRTFCLKGPDIGQLHHLNVNLVGARSDKEWFLKEIEITNLNSSVTWLCEFNCWLPKLDGQEPHYQIKPIMNPHTPFSFDNLSVYILQVRTGGRRFAGTDSNIQVSIRGSTSQTRRLQLTSDGADLFEQNQLDTFAIVGWDIGDLLEIIVESDKTQVAADWDVKEMTMWKIIPSNDHKQFQVYFPFNTWLGKKVSTIKAKGEIHSSTDHRPRGPTCYQIAVKTGKVVGAGTDANVFIIIYGNSGRTAIHQLDNARKNDFERDTTSEFTIMDIDVGKIDRIKIWHDNSNPGAAWFLDTVIIRKKHSTCRPITNVFIQRLEQISKILYNQASEQLRKNHKAQTSSTKENEHRSKDRSSSQLKDYDDLGSNRSILRPPIIYDKANLQKKVTWDEHNLGSQDESFSYDTKRMKNMQKSTEQKHTKDDSPSRIESGHFDHRAYWISSHNYTNNKWQIKSIEEQNSFNIDQSTRTLLLSDRLTISSKIKTPIHEKDDDVYEFEANRWLAKDKNDGKLEVYLIPKAIQLSTHTSNELKSKPSSDTINDLKKKHLPPPSKSSSDIRHDDEYSKRLSQFDLESLQRSPRSLTSSDRPPHDISKTHIDESRSSQRSHMNSSSTLKRQEETFIDKYQRPASPNQHSKSPHNPNDRIIPPASERELLARISGEPSYNSRSAATSVIDPRSSELYNQRSKSPRLNNEPTHPPSSNRDVLSRMPTSTSLIDTRSSTLYDPRLKSSGLINEPTNSLVGKRDVLSRMATTTSSIDTRSSEMYDQRSRSPRLNNESPHPPSSNRDILSRMPTSASSIDTRSSTLHDPRSKSSGLNNETTNPSVGKRDVLSRMPATTSSIDTRSSEMYDQRSRSPRLNTEPTHPPSGNRDVLSRMPATTSLIDTRSSALYDPRSKSSGLANEPTNLSVGKRDVLSRMPATTSSIDPRASEMYDQRSRSPRLNNESPHPPSSNRDILSRMPADPPVRPKSAARSTIEPSSQRPTRNQVYGSAYGTLPRDNF